MDPMGQHTDRELIAVLKHVRLWDVLCGLSLSHAKAEQASVAISTPQPQAGAPASPQPPAAMPIGDAWLILMIIVMRALGLLLDAGPP